MGGRGRFVQGLTLATVLAALLSQAALAQTPPPPVEPAAIKTATVRRSAAIFACAPKTPPAEFCRSKPAFNAYDARERLGRNDFTLWIDGLNLNVAARSEAEAVDVTGTFDEGLSPLSVGLPFYGATYHLPDIDRAIVELRLRGQPADQPALVFRGSEAPPAPPSNASLKGRVEVLDLQSAALGARRRVSVYIPPGAAPKDGWPTIIAADGDAIEPYMAILDALIERGEVRPVAMVAVWSGLDPADRATGGLRSREYLRRADANAYLRHAMFVRREVLPAVEKRFHLAAHPSERMLLGSAEGADWVLETAVRDPDMAQTVAAFSPPGFSDPAFRGGKGKGLRLYLAAGAYEGPFLKGARTLCNLAIASFVPCTLDVTASGHAPLAWQAEFAKVVKTVFPARAGHKG